MSRLRLILISMLAVFAVGAVASSSALADEETCKNHREGEPEIVYCINEPGPPKVGNDGALTETVASTGGEGVLTVTEGPSIKCTAEKDTVTITQKDSDPFGKDEKLITTFTGCTIVGAEETCTVQDSAKKLIGTIEVGPDTSTLKSVGGKFYDVITPVGNLFVTLEIKNKIGKTCLAKGTFKVTGEACGEVGAIAVKNTLTFSEAIEKACKAPKPLELGLKKAFLKLTSTQELTGARKGDSFGVIES